MAASDYKCRAMEEELKTFWPQWHVVRYLGGGAFGDVFQIYKEDCGLRVDSALKIIQISDPMAELTQVEPQSLNFSGDGHGGQSGIPETLRNEIRIMELLRGAPNIVVAEDFYFKKGPGTNALFVRMELLKSFQDVLRENMRKYEETFSGRAPARDGKAVPGGIIMSIGNVLKVGKDICRALVYCEQKGIIHRDIKPANLFVDSFGNYKVGDFGASKHMETVYAAHTMTGVGTISYMAPEIYAGKSYNNTVDIYSLGLVLYQLLNGSSMPFLPSGGRYTKADIDSANYRRLQGTSVPSLTEQIVRGAKNCGTVITYEEAEGLDRIIHRACEADPLKRYQSAGDFYRALDGYGRMLAEKGKAADSLTEEKRPESREKPVSPVSPVSPVNPVSSVSPGSPVSLGSPVSSVSPVSLGSPVSSPGRPVSSGRPVNSERSISPGREPVDTQKKRGEERKQLEGQKRREEQEKQIKLQKQREQETQKEQGTQKEQEKQRKKEEGQTRTRTGKINRGNSPRKWILPAAAFFVLLFIVANILVSGIKSIGLLGRNRQITDSWEEIIAAGRDGTYSRKYRIGDTKEIDLRREGTVTMRLVAMNEDELADGSGKAPMTWIADELLNTKYHMNAENTNAGGWEAAEMRSWLQESVLPLMPLEVQEGIREVKKYSYSYEAGKAVTSTETIWIPSAREVFFADNSDWIDEYYETKGVDYSKTFPNDASRKRSRAPDSETSWWWLRSTSYNYSELFRYVAGDGSTYANDIGSAGEPGGVVLAFCL